jgi:hypothetical protein
MYIHFYNIVLNFRSAGLLSVGGLDDTEAAPIIFSVRQN